MTQVESLKPGLESKQVWNRNWAAERALKHFCSYHRRTGTLGTRGGAARGDGVRADAEAGGLAALTFRW